MRPAVSIKTTSVCQATCDACIARQWMSESAGFHMSLEDLEDFVRYSSDAGYVYRYIILSGGEPLLWQNLREGVELLHKAGLTKQLKLFTNGLAIQESRLDLIDHVLKHLTVLRVSTYEGNEENVDLLKSSFPDARNIRLYRGADRVVSPAIEDAPKPVPGSVPAACACPNFSVIGGRIFLCSGSHFVIGSLGWDPEAFPYIETEVGPDFLSAFQGIDRLSQPFCQFCVSNKLVRSGAGRVEVHCR